MIKLVRNSVSILFLVVYCWTLVIFSINRNANTSVLSDDSTKSIHFSISSSDLYSHTFQSELSTINFSFIPAKVTIDAALNHITQVRLTNCLALAELKQYINSSLNHLVHSRKTDILFPFQYFW